MRAHIALVTAASLAAGLGLVLSDTAGALPGVEPRTAVSATIGQLAADPAAASTCGSAFTTVVASSSAVPGQYVAPFAGVITFYSYNAKAVVPGQVRPVLFVDAGGSFSQVGHGELLNIGPGKVNINTPTRIPVPAGAVLGMQFSNGAMACATPDPGSTVTSSASYDPDAPAGPLTGTTTAARLNASAVLETDLDGDGYGDATQDPCPETAGVRAPCPAPDTRITRKPKKRSTRRAVRLAFGSSIPGSTFTCAVDRSTGPQTCTSPFKRRLTYGKHVIVVMAYSHGVPDLTPARVRFRIIRP